MQKIFHLSHIDLDGYGAQFVMGHFFKDIKFFNANYGREISVRLDQILNCIKNDPKGKFIIFITDLNLSTQECQDLEDRICGLNVRLQLLDHHISGQECAQKYSWYELNPKICATKITFEYLKANFTPIKNIDYLPNLVEVINSIDTWDENGFGFDIGKVAMRIISASNELNRSMFEDENRTLKLNLINEFKNFIPKTQKDTKKAAIALDNATHEIKKRLLGGDPNNEILDDIISNIQCNLLFQKKSLCEVFYKEKRGFLSYGMGGISVLGNKFLKENSDFDFYIDINSRGNVSLRANNTCDVSEIASICFGGGGHKNASGGKLSNFKESFVYEDIRLQLQEALNQN